MTYAPTALQSLHGRQLGIDSKGYLVSNLRDGVFPLLVYSSTAASTAISNTTTETAFSTASFSIPANSLRAGALIKFGWQGIATSTNSTDTLLIKAYINSTSVATGTATDVANNDMFEGEAQAIIRTIGSSGTFVAKSNHTKVPAASLTATRVTQLTASTTVDTTAAVVISVQATWSVASASNSCRLDLFHVEIG